MGRNQPVIPVVAVLIPDGKGAVLTVRKRGTHRFMFPGGKPEEGESEREAAVREVAEELGVDLDPDRLMMVGRYETAAANEVDHRIAAAVFGYDSVPVAGPRGEIDELRWDIPEADPLPDDLAPLARLVFFQLAERTRQAEQWAAEEVAWRQQQLEQWDEYAANPAPSSTAADDLVGVMAGPDGPDPADLLAPFPWGPAVAARVAELHRRTRWSGAYWLPDPARARPDDELLELARAQTEECRRWLAAHGHPDAAAGLPDSVRFGGEADLAAVEWAAEGVDVMHAAWIDAYCDAEPHVHGVREVLLHLTMDPWTTDWLLRAAVPFDPVTFEPGFELYVGGGWMVIGDDEVIVTRR